MPGAGDRRKFLERNEDGKCAAMSKSGKRCANKALPGLAVCRRHGGSTPRAKAKTARALAEQQAYAAMARFGTHVEINPLDALLGELYRSAGIVAWFEDQLGATPVQLSGMTALASEFRPDAGDEEGIGNGPALTVREESLSVDEDGRETIKIRIVENPLLGAFRKERQHLVQVAAECVKLGLEERVVDAHIAAVRADVLPKVVEMMRDVVAELGAISPDMAEAAKAVIARQMSMRRVIDVAPELG